MTGLVFSILFSIQVWAEDIRVEPLRTKEEIDLYYCKVTTGDPKRLEKEPCFTPNHYPLDVVYVPLAIGEQIVSHINSAWKGKMYLDISNSDFFHGHPITHGPQITYESAREYFADLVGFLYHSDEYTNRWWKDHTVPKTPRSFVGFMGISQVVAGIDLMSPDVPLFRYEKSGTLYLEQILASQPALSKHTGKEKIFMRTGADDKPCEVLNSVYFIKDANGRFRVASGETVEMFLQCKYY